MINKFVKYFFIFTILLVFGFILFLTFDSDFRRYSFSRLIGAYKLYQIVSLQSYLKSGNVKGASNKLLNYIEVSEKISNGKSSLLYGIYDAAKLVESKVSSKKDYLLLQDVFKKLVEQDPELYEARIWLAKSSRYTNIKNSFRHLDKAIAISPAQDNAYRLAIKIAQEEGDKKLAQIYCKKYKNAKFGGNLPRYDKNYFGGNVITKFGIEFLPEGENSTVYTHSGIQLNNFNDYEFSPIEPIDVDGFRIYLSFLPGIKIDIKEINIINSELDKKISLNNITATSKSAFIDDENNEYISFLILKEGQEILQIKFKDRISSMNKIIIKMKISKLKLANNTLCE